jgi:hypothetical protein
MMAGRQSEFLIVLVLIPYQQSRRPALATTEHGQCASLDVRCATFFSDTSLCLASNAA